MTRELFFEKWGPGPAELWLSFESDLAALIGAERTELLEALKAVSGANLGSAFSEANFMESGVDFGSWERGFADALDTVRRIARAAIAKAEGREP